MGVGLFIVFVLRFLHRIAGEAASESFEDFLVHFAEHYGAMYLTSPKLRQLCQSAAAVVVVFAQNGNGYQHFIGVKTRVVTMQVLDFGLLYRLNHFRRYEFYVMVYAGKVLCRI